MFNSHRSSWAARLALCVLMAPTVASAEAPDSTAPTAEVPAETAPTTAPAPAPAEVSQEEVDQLRERLRAMEQRVDGLEATEQSAGPQEVPLDLDTAAHIYAATEFGASYYIDSGEPEHPVGFAMKDLVFTYGANLDRKMSAYTEIAFEPSDAEIAVDLEVIQINWNISDAFSLVAGRVHAPWSYWANTSLHGEYRYLPLAVPEILSLEDEGGGWMPIHQVGLWAGGKAFLGYWQLSWQAGLSNGRSTTIGWIAQEGDTELNKAINGHLWLESPDGLLLGLGGYTDQMTMTTDQGASPEETKTGTNGTDTMPTMGEHIGNLTVLYRGGRVELSAEGFVIVHTQAGQTGTSFGGFAVAGLKLDRWTPYLLTDVMALDTRSPHYLRVGDYEPVSRGGLGVRHELGLRLALKAQVTAGIESHVTSMANGEAAVESRPVSQAAVQLAAGF